MRPASVVFLICFVHTAYSRDFYMGMFRKNDFLVAADELHKARVPSRFTWAQYGRVFKCPITYFRVVDRLGTNIMPRVEILRGGLLMKYIVVRLSVYNRPISVNIYVGCENKRYTLPKRTKPTTEETTVAGDDNTGGEDGEEEAGDTTVGGEEGGDADGTAAEGAAEGDRATTAGGEGGDAPAGEEEAPAEERRRKRH